MSLVDFGTFSETFTLAGDTNRRTVEGNYVAVLEQEVGGDWKVRRLLPPRPIHH